MPHKQRGMVLAAVLVVVLLCSMVAASVLFRMQAENSAATSAVQGEHAYDAAASGLQLVLAMLSPPQDDLASDGTVTVDPNNPQAAADKLGPFANPAVLADPALWHDNPDLFRHRFAFRQGGNDWYFSVFAANATDPNSVRFGLADESGKININTADADTLLKLPGMTPALVDALLDYRDADSDPRTDGAEQDYYDQLPRPYTIKNGPFTTLEELLLVKGFNASILHGEDANLNTLLEPNEDDGNQSFPPDNNDGVLDQGLYGCATTVNFAPDLTYEGKPKADLNGQAQALEGLGLKTQTLDFIKQYKADGNKFVHASQLLGMKYTTKGSSGGGGGGRGPFGAGRGGQQQPKNIDSAVTVDDMPIIMDKLTAAPGQGRVPVIGMLNVNTASAQALAALPGLDAGLAQEIVDARANLDPQTRGSTAWLLTQGLLTADQYKTLAPRLCARGYQFRLRIVGYGVPCGRFRVIEALIDVAGPQPRVLYQRDVTKLGLPFPLDMETQQQ